MFETQDPMPGCFELRAAGSAAGGTGNDDAFGATGQYLWVVDGATDVGVMRCTRHTSDAAWLAETIHHWLLHATQGQTARPLQVLLQGLEAHLRAAFAAELRAAGLAQVDRRDAPTACLGLVYLAGSELQAVCVGDVSIAALAAHAVPWLLSDREHEVCAARTRFVLREARNEGLSGEAMRQRIRPVLRANRALANQPDGYRIVHPQQSWAAGAAVHTVCLPQDARVLLATDGLWRLVDVFRDCDAQGLVERLDALGFDHVVAHLRSLEAADPEGQLYVRVKCHDDATAVLARAQVQAHAGVWVGAGVVP